MSAVSQSPSTNVPKVAWWRVLSWQMYDFADTIYSMNVYTFYFGLFLFSAYGKNATDFGWALTVANLVVAITSPLLGAMSDASQRRLPFLRLFAVLTAISTALIAFAPSYIMAVLLFVLSYFFYQTAWNFYQALLPGLCNEENVSRVSGTAIGLGYVGSIFGVVSMMVLIGGEEQYPLVFLYSATLYMLFAIPALTVVPDFAPPTEKLQLDLGKAYQRVYETITHARRFPGLFRFLVADFVYENAIAAAIGFMTVYAKAVAGFTDENIQVFFIFSTLFAVVTGFALGPVVDRVGPKRSVIGTLLLWMAILPMVAMATKPVHFNFIGPLVGIGLAAVWTSSRTYLVALAPVEKSGEFFGLYALSGKSASVLGTAVWTLVLVLLTDRVGENLALRSAVWVMLLFIIVGFLMVRTLPDVRPTRANILDRSKTGA
ncbi:MAG: MFS transporter [Bacillota bacterium]